LFCTYRCSGFLLVLTRVAIVLVLVVVELISKASNSKNRVSISKTFRGRDLESRIA